MAAVRATVTALRNAVTSRPISTRTDRGPRDLGDGDLRGDAPGLRPTRQEPRRSLSPASSLPSTASDWLLFGSRRFLDIIAGGGSNTVLSATGFAAAITESTSTWSWAPCCSAAPREHVPRNDAGRGMEFTPVSTFPASGYTRLGAHGRHKYVLTVRTRASDKTTLALMHILSPPETPTAVAVAPTSRALVVGLSGSCGMATREAGRGRPADERDHPASFRSNVSLGGTNECEGPRISRQNGATRACGACKPEQQDQFSADRRTIPERARSGSSISLRSVADIPHLRDHAQHLPALHAARRVTFLVMA
jgi:hypothetical protein